MCRVWSLRFNLPYSKELGSLILAIYKKHPNKNPIVLHVMVVVVVLGVRAGVGGFKRGGGWLRKLITWCYAVRLMA